MFNLNLFKNIGFLLYLFVYLIIPYSAITQTLKVDFIRNLENSLNARDLKFIGENFRKDENQNILKQFSKTYSVFYLKINNITSIPSESILWNTSTSMNVVLALYSYLRIQQMRMI